MRGVVLLGRSFCNGMLLAIPTMRRPLSGVALVEAFGKLLGRHAFDAPGLLEDGLATLLGDVLEPLEGDLPIDGVVDAPNRLEGTRLAMQQLGLVACRETVAARVDGLSVMLDEGVVWEPDAPKRLSRLVAAMLLHHPLGEVDPGRPLVAARSLGLLLGWLLEFHDVTSSLGLNGKLQSTLSALHEGLKQGRWGISEPNVH